MSRPDVAAIRGRADAATPGEWRAETDCFDPDTAFIEACVTNIDGTDHSQSLLFTSSTDLSAYGSGNWAKATASQEMRAARFIAASRTDVPALCDRVEELEKALGSVIEWANEPREATGRDFARLVAVAFVALEGTPK
jgi:hypothetical protein